MKKIIMWCKKFNLNFDVQQLRGGYSRIAIECSRNEFSAVFSALHKVAARKNWSIDTNTLLSVIYVYNAAEREEMQELDRQQTELVNVFYDEYRKHQDGNKAKQVQYVYALQHGFLKAFNGIYN